MEEFSAGDSSSKKMRKNCKINLTTVIREGISIWLEVPSLLAMRADPNRIYHLLLFLALPFLTGNPKTFATDCTNSHGLFLKICENQ